MGGPADSEDDRRGFRAATSIRIAVRAAGVLVALGAVTLQIPGCRSPRDDAVPGCPVCGDPITTRGPDGRGRVIGRLRLREDGAAAIHAALGLTPWATGRSDDLGADSR